MTTNATAPFLVESFLTIDKTTLIAAPDATAFLTSAMSGPAQPDAAVSWGLSVDDDEAYIGWRVSAGGQVAEFMFPEETFSFLGEVIRQGGSVQLTAASAEAVQALADATPAHAPELQPAMEPALLLVDAHLLAVPAFLQTVREIRHKHPKLTNKILQAFGR